MHQLIKELTQYMNGHPDTHIKNRFFKEIIELIAENKLTVATLTEKLADLTPEERSALFQKLIGTATSVDWINTLYTTMGVPLKKETLDSLVYNEPSRELIKHLVNSPYRLWLKSPLNERRMNVLEHEMNGALGFLSKENEHKSLAELIQKSEIRAALPAISMHAPEYLPIVLEQMHQIGTDDEKQTLMQCLKELAQTGQYLEAILKSSPAIVAELVRSDAALYFKASESMRVAVNRRLYEENDTATLDSLTNQANQLFDHANESRRAQFVLDGFYRFKEVRLSQTEQALDAISAYRNQQPNEYKAAFFAKLAADIQEGGLTVGLLQEHLNNADTEQLFSKWNGKTNSRASGLMASLYRLASFGTDLDMTELEQMVEQKQLPQIEEHSRSEESVQDLDWLRDNIAQAIEDEVDSLIALDQTKCALKAIQTYLDLNPGAYKSEFFIALRDDIEDNKLTVALLQKHLTQTDNNELFSKWAGLDKSRAAELMASLYNIASLGMELSPEQFEEMVFSQQLPSDSNTPAALVALKIEEVIMNPDRSNSSHLAAKIGQVFEEIQAQAQYLHNNQYNIQLNAEAVYQRYLLQKGLNLAENLHSPPFDLQGRVMVAVTLDEQDYLEILDLLGYQVQEGEGEATLKSLLGSNITRETLCNIDIKGSHILEKKFKIWVGRNEAYDVLMNSEDRSSIIGLQEEMIMHVLLSLRVFQNKIPSLVTDGVRQNLSMDINDFVKEAFRRALTKAYSFESDEINYELLNKELDAERRSLAPICMQNLVNNLFNLNPEVEWDAELAKIKKHDFTSTTATGLDYLRSDRRNQSLVRISATEATAHDKQLGADTQAFRVLHRTHYDLNAEPIVRPYPEHTLEARVPSIAVKESAELQGVRDVADKLWANHRLLRQQAAYSSEPMVYNLLTSLHTQAYDNFFFERNNKQRLSAEYILNGSHLYNFRQLRLGEPNALVYVQNIPVNQHTNELSDSAFDDVTKEAAIMSELALLSTLNHYAGSFSSALRQSISQEYSYVHQQYVEFLPQVEHQIAYFHKAEQGIQVISHLNAMKEQWNSVELHSSEPDQLSNLAVHALFKMYASNDYRNKQFGMLVQSLSVFVEPMSQAGCKSANERYQGVSGRVELLKSINIRPDAQLSSEEKDLKVVMHQFVTGQATPAQMQQSLDTAYNKHNLYGAAVVFSEEDQGAASKLKATRNKDKPGVISEADTNIAETGYLTRLHQKYCSIMQAHKANLVELFKKLFSEKVEASQNEISMS